MTCWSCVRCIKEWANGCWDANEMTWKNPCTTEWVNWWTNESTNQGINEPVSQWLRESLKQRSNDSMNQATSEPMNRWVSESKTQWTNGCTIQRVNESLNLLNQWTKEAMNQWMKQFSQIHRPTAIWSLQFLWFFSTKQIGLKCTCCSRYSLVHILPTASSKSAPRLSVLQHFEVEIEHVLQSWALFVNHFRR